MKEFLSRIDELIKEARGRVANPMVLSFILVWLYFHWRLTYEILTLDTEYPALYRSEYLSQYVRLQGWNGMIGKPLLFSAISLAGFYLIGALGNFIKLWMGKRLLAAITAKWDRGKYDLKAETDKFKSKYYLIKEEVDELKTQLENSKSELEKYRGNSEHEIGRLEGIVDSKERELGKIESEKKQLEKAADFLKDQMSKALSDKEEFERALKFEKEQKEGTSLHMQELKRQINELSGVKGSVITDPNRVFPNNSRWNIEIVGLTEKRLNGFFTIRNNTFISDSQSEIYSIDNFEYYGVIRYMKFTTSVDSILHTFILVGDLNQLEFSGFDLTINSKATFSIVAK